MVSFTAASIRATASLGVLCRSAAWKAFVVVLMMVLSLYVVGPIEFVLRQRRSSNGTASVAACLRLRERRMPRVIPAILRTDVHNERLGPLSLDLQGGDQRIIGVHHEVIHLSFHL